MLPHFLSGQSKYIGVKSLFYDLEFLADLLDLNFLALIFMVKLTSNFHRYRILIKLKDYKLSGESEWDFQERLQLNVPELKCMHECF